jgi:SAM-dependent methyltransferase
VGDLQTYPLPEDEFDVVVCWDVLEHIPHPYEGLRNLVRAVRPGGLLVIGFPNALSLKGLITKFSPHWFHVWAAHRIFRAPREVAEGGPVPTHLRFSLRPTQLLRFASDQRLLVQYVALYGDDPTSSVLADRWMRLAWRITAAAVKLTSFGAVEDRRSEIVAVLSPRSDSGPVERAGGAGLSRPGCD